jgi:hypothetical protein
MTRQVIVLTPSDDDNPVTDVQYGDGAYKAEKIAIPDTECTVQVVAGEWGNRTEFKQIIVPVLKPKMVKGVGWANIYRSGVPGNQSGLALGAFVYNTEEEVLANKTPAAIATVHFDYEVPA